ncbi:MAG: TetR/AcrR family transcriptional regulator [Myxococcota bacterium]
MRRALVEAAAPLLAARPDLRVRAVAAAAGVNHGLVHRHFGSKEALRRAVLEHLATRLGERLAPLDEKDALALDDAFAAAFRAVKEEGLYWRVLARTLLDTAPEGEAPDREVLPSSLQSVFPIARALVERARAAGHPDPRALVAERLALGLGWLLFGPFLRAATGLEAHAEERVLASFEGHGPRRIGDGT